MRGHKGVLMVVCSFQRIATDAESLEINETENCLLLDNSSVYMIVCINNYNPRNSNAPCIFPINCVFMQHKHRNI